MNQQDFSELENYIFDHKVNPKAAAQVVADIIGVLIDLKPACVFGFTMQECAMVDFPKLAERLVKMGLRCVFDHRITLSETGQIEWNENAFIAKDLQTALDLTKSFRGLWRSMDDTGYVIDSETWARMTKEVGTLLGYPATAVDKFAAEDDYNSEETQARIDRYFYYTHSAEHEEDEFQAYDRVLNAAIDRISPKSAELLKQDSNKRWL